MCLQMMTLASLNLPRCALCNCSRTLHCSSAAPSRVLDTSKLRQRVKRCGSQAPHSFSLQQLLDMAANRPALYCLLREELPVRLAHFITSLPVLLPREVREQRLGQFLQDYTEMSFKEVEAFPPSVESMESGLEKKWLEVLTRIGIRLGGTTEMIAEAVLSTSLLRDPVNQNDLQRDLPIILRQNLSIDALVSVYRPRWTKLPSGTPTCIQPDNELLEDIKCAYEDARYLCEQHYIACPDLNVSKETDSSSFTSVPAHNYLIFFEIFKNALRATVEYHGEACPNLPPVGVKITKENEMLVVKVKDHGGGMDVDQEEKASKFFSSTAELDRMSLYQGAHSSPLAGHGFGLGIARLYCSYWGGDLLVKSEKGEGTTVTLTWFENPKLAKEML